MLRERTDHRRELFLQTGNPPPEIEPEIQRDLLVARAAGVQPLAQIADALDELPLDECVHIFVGTVDERGLAPASLENVRERRGHLLRFGRVEDAGAGEPFNPRKAARHIVFEETPVESKGRPELEGNGIGLAAETSGPEIRHRLLRHRGGGTICALRRARRAFFAAVSTGSPQILMKPSAAE